ncbi:MAG TPA: TIGR00303 family protein, partial [Methanothermococcus okinawensis]|nr:TIGR00303 family protein [Methanothermococcus okinawensis]
MSLSSSIISINDNNFLEAIRGKRPLFISVISNIETTKYLPISGVKREVIDYTPAADMELVVLGRSVSLPSPPVDANTCPSPATITRANVHLRNIPVLTVDAGAEVKPKIPPSTYIQVDRRSTGDISRGLAMENSKKLFEVGREIGRRLVLEREFQVAIIGECVPGGTTSALGVLLGLGYDAEDKVSSGSVKNPRELKLKVVREGLKRVKSRDVFDILNAVGDKMMPVVAGMVFSLVKCKKYVILGGGTQMASVLAVIKEIEGKLKESVLDSGYISLGTTEFLLRDRYSDIRGLVEEIGEDIPLYAARFHYERSRIEGLRAYCRGAVKEGVGAGGIS